MVEPPFEEILTTDRTDQIELILEIIPLFREED